MIKIKSYHLLPISPITKIEPKSALAFNRQRELNMMNHLKEIPTHIGDAALKSSLKAFFSKRKILMVDTLS